MRRHSVDLRRSCLSCRPLHNQDRWRFTRMNSTKRIGSNASACADSPSGLCRSRSARVHASELRRRLPRPNVSRSRPRAIVECELIYCDLESPLLCRRTLQLLASALPSATSQSRRVTNKVVHSDGQQFSHIRSLTWVKSLSRFSFEAHVLHFGHAMSCCFFSGSCGAQLQGHHFGIAASLASAGCNTNASWTKAEARVQPGSSAQIQPCLL